ncbi:MAG: hypothetical protein WCD35_04860 [Mycobacteriales bacterium]
MYSLVSASVLAIDLARHSSGTAVADAVDRVLALTPAELAALGTPAPDDVRQRVLDACTGEPRMSTLMDGVAATFAEGLPDATTSRTILTALCETPVGGLGDLLAMLEGELAPCPGRQVALDAVTVAWAGRQADLTDLARLRAPWAAAVPAVPASLPDTPYAERLRGLLDQVARRRPEQWQQVVAAHAVHRGSFRWSTAMHQACQAAYEADRLVEVARAQLAAARSLRLSGASTGPHSHAVGMAVTAAVQAVCVEALVSPDITRTLLLAWEGGS